MGFHQVYPISDYYYYLPFHAIVQSVTYCISARVFYLQRHPLPPPRCKVIISVSIPLGYDVVMSV